jgi:hypothetical protein
MAATDHLPEAVLARIWEEQLFRTDQLQTTAGAPVHILRRGRRNADNGPDFKGVLLRFGDAIVTGDVELHLTAADWYAHGHHHDPSYDRTILHVVLWESSEIPLCRTASGVTVPTVIVQSRLSVPIEHVQERFQQADDQVEALFAECRQRLAAMPVEQLFDCLQDLGRQRLHDRARRFAQWRSPAASWQQLLYEAICEGLGYSSNTYPFVELARRLPLATIITHLAQEADGSMTNNLFRIQAMLFGAAGLLPEPDDSGPVDPETDEYVSKLRALWGMLRPCLDVQPMPREAWHFFRLRPPNFPTRRLAALSYLIANYTVQPLFENYQRLFTLLSTRSELVKNHSRLLEHTFVIPASGYWQGRHTFGQRSAAKPDRFFIGKARGREILISAVFPVLLLSALQAGNRPLETGITALYEVFPAPGSNRITTTMHHRLFASRGLRPQAVIRTASLYQGVLTLYKTYCCLPACTACPVRHVR